MWNLMRETWHVIKLNIRHLLLFELIYRLITVPVYLAVTNRCLRWALDMAGYSYVTAGNLGRFLIQPGTVAVILLLLFLFLMFLVMEIGGLLTVFQAAAYHRRVPVYSIFAGGFFMVWGELRRRNWKLFLVLFVHSVLIHGFFLYRLLLHIKPLNFIVPELLKLNGSRQVFCLLSLIFLGLAAATVFVCFGCMVEQKSFFGSRNRSVEIVKRHPLSVFSLLVLVNLAVPALCVLLYLVCTLLTAVLAVEFVESSRQLAVLLDAGSRLEISLIFLGSALTLMANYASLTVLYFQYGNEREENQRWDFALAGEKPVVKKRFLSILAVVAGISLVILLDSLRTGFAAENELLGQTQITAHRGSSSRAPENTLSALQAAIEDLADYAEIDVQMTADGVIVLGHDGSWGRVAGVNKTVTALSYEETRKLDVGSWYSEDFAGETVPTLEQVLELCQGKLNLNIEIKYSSADNQLPERVAALIEEKGLEDQCVITSTRLTDLRRVKAVTPKLRTGYILTAAYGAYYKEEALDFISIRSGNLTEGLVRAAHEQGKGVHVWTVNGKSELERMKKMGVDNVITDYPVYARGILFQEEQVVSLLESIRLMLEQ